MLIDNWVGYRLEGLQLWRDDLLSRASIKPSFLNTTGNRAADSRNRQAKGQTIEREVSKKRVAKSTCLTIR
jgi:hypothetical protein